MLSVVRMSAILYSVCSIVLFKEICVVTTERRVVLSKQTHKKKKIPCVCVCVCVCDVLTSKLGFRHVAKRLPKTINVIRKCLVCRHL